MLIIKESMLPFEKKYMQSNVTKVLKKVSITMVFVLKMFNLVIHTLKMLIKPLTYL